MSNEQKRELVYLLHLYMHDLIRYDKTNRKKIEDVEKKGGYAWSIPDLETGVKSQYNHARCIERKLAKDVEETIRANV